MIVIGGFFLAATMGMVEWGMIRPLFARYWPLLLIILGLIKLVEYQYAQRTGTRPTGMGRNWLINVLHLGGCAL